MISNRLILNRDFKSPVLIFDFDFKSFGVGDFEFDFKIILRLAYDFKPSKSSSKSSFLLQSLTHNTS